MIRTIAPTIMMAASAAFGDTASDDAPDAVGPGWDRAAKGLTLDRGLMAASGERSDGEELATAVA